MTAVLIEDDHDHDGDPAEQPPALASWGARAGAFALDVFVGLGVCAALFMVAWATRQREWLWWVCVLTAALVVLGVAINRLVLPTITGWSMGRAVLGVRVHRRDGTVPGPWRLLARDGLHLLDTAAAFVGWLWPLWDSRRRTFADILTGTEVRTVASQPPRASDGAATVLTVAAAIAVVAAGLGYLTVYRHDLRQTQSRQELAVQGPKLVTEMLSYHKDSWQEDFAHAKSIVTEGYRPQLEEQQRNIQQGEIVDNEYWSPNAAVLEATADRGTVLVLMQGQRGTAPNYRTISATVKAEFERVDDGGWKLANLTVLSKPRTAGGGR